VFDRQTTNPRVSFALRLCSSLLTALLIVAVVGFHRAAHRFDCLQRPYLEHLFLWSRDRMISFAIEFFVCAIHAPPSLHMLYDVTLSKAERPLIANAVNVVLPRISAKTSAIWFGPWFVENPWEVIMVLRLYLIARLMLVQSYRTGPLILACWVNFSLSPFFTIRSTFYRAPALVVGCATIFLFFISSFALYICDRALGYQWSSYAGTLWLAFASMTTLGYGDLYPGTICGRMVALFSAVIGIILMSGIFAALTSFLAVSPKDTRMIDFIEMYGLKQRRLYWAAAVIQRAWFLFQSRRRLRGACNFALLISLLCSALSFSLSSSLSLFMCVPNRISTFCRTQLAKC
jgi:hypothetical protein